MELNLRPMTEAERLYCYGQSQQIMAQTGCVGHLRADMDTDGRGFFSSWDDHIGYLKTQEFKDEFEVVIDSLRFDSGVLANRTAVQKFCAAHPEAQITPDRPDYGFRTDTVQYAYLFRLNPTRVSITCTATAGTGWTSTYRTLHEASGSLTATTRSCSASPTADRSESFTPTARLSQRAAATLTITMWRWAPAVAICSISASLPNGWKPAAPW